jgi:PAS domain S-box-containing protein
VAELTAQQEGLLEPDGDNDIRTMRAEMERLELVALRTMAAAVRDGLSVEGAVAHCLSRTIEHLGLDFGCIYVRRHDYLICLATQGLGGNPVVIERASHTDSLGAEEQTAAPPLIPIAEASWAQRPFVARHVDSLGAKSWMALPLSIGPALVGVLVLGGRGGSVGALPPLTMARRLVEPLAVAIDNAERYAGLRGLLNDTRDIIFRTDADGRWTYLNTAWQETFGQPVALSLGSRVISHVAPDYRGRLGPGLQALVPQGSVIGRQTAPFLVRQGKVRWMDVQARLVFDDRGHVVGAAGVLRDVSVAVRQARELEDANRLLRSRARALEEANRELSETDRLKSDFLCNVSHELRTPLAIMLGYTEMLEDGLPDSPTDGQREFLSFIREGGQQLQRRIQDVLLMTSLEGGKVTVEPRRTAVWPVIENVAQTYAQAAAGRGLILRLEPGSADQPELWVETDPRWLEQALGQLFDNAVKFSRRGGCLTVSAERLGGRVRLKLVDDGEGLAPDVVPTLFHKFVQADGSQTRRHGGLGLGLVLARGLLALMSATVELDSPGPDQGVTATIELPAA